MGSPLLAALYRGSREEAVDLAAERELDVFEAAALGNSARLRALLSANPEDAHRCAPDGFTPLHLLAFFSGDIESARLLLDAGADPNATAANDTQLKPINSAAAAAANEVVTLLIQRGADVDAVQRGGYTALHSAAANGNRALAQLLLDAGAAVTASDDGRTPQDLARERGHSELAAQLDREAAART
jgi:uncharacterized protein